MALRTNIISAIIGTLILLALISSRTDTKGETEFARWMLEHGRVYSMEDYVYRYAVFKKTVETVNEHNARYERGEESYYMAVNMFADMTDEEFAARYLTKESPIAPEAYNCTGSQPPSKDVPAQFDWAAKSAVTEVRTQGQCVSSYAITTAQSIESGRFITTTILRKLSSQQIIDCSKDQGNQGCKGGNILSSFQYVKRGGIALDSAYPYTDKEGQCSYNLGKKQWEILGCVAVTPKVENSMKAAVYHQPIIASLNAQKLKTYSGGIYEAGRLSSCSTTANTWMLMVGYGTDKKTGYWKLKNSWGSKWGSNGYLYIVRKGDGQGQCGVQKELYYPLA